MKSIIVKIKSIQGKYKNVGESFKSSSQPHILFLLANFTKYLIISLHRLGTQTSQQRFVEWFEILHHNEKIIKVLIPIFGNSAVPARLKSHVSSSKIRKEITWRDFSWLLKTKCYRVLFPWFQMWFSWLQSYPVVRHVPFLTIQRLS